MTPREPGLVARIVERFAGRPGLRRAAGNASWLALERVMRMILGVIVGVQVAVYLGPESYGLLSYALALVTVFGVAARLGLNRIVVRELVGRLEDGPRILGTTLVLRAGAGLAMWAAVIAASFAADPVDRTSIALVAVVGATIPLQALEAIELRFEAEVATRGMVLARTIALVLVSVARLVMVVQQAPLIAFAWAACCETLVIGVGFVVAHRARGLRISTWRFRPELARAMLLESWPEIVAGVATLLIMRLDVLLLGQLATSADVGVYAAAARLSEIWYFAPVVIVGSTFPALVEARSRDPVRYRKRLQQLLSALVALGYAVAIPTTIVATPLVTLLFGDAYRESASVLTIHVWTGVLVAFGTASGSWIFAEKLVRLSLYRTLLGAATCLALNLILIPRFGPVGAAWATLLAQLVAFYGFDLLFAPMREVFVMKTKALALTGLLDR